MSQNTVYGLVGTSYFQVGGDLPDAPGWIVMQSQRPDAHTYEAPYVAQSDGTWLLIYNRAAVVDRLNFDFEAAATRATLGWPEFEMQTWTIQTDEARQWTAAAPADKPLTPFLTQLWTDRASRGWSEDFSALVARVLSNNASFVLATANLLAIRHSAERDISAASNPTLVTWSFP